MKTKHQPGLVSTSTTIPPGDFMVSSFSTLMDQSDEGFFFLDTEFNIIYLNSKANVISQKTYAVSYKVGENIIGLAPEHRKPTLRRALTKALHGEIVKFEVRFTHSHEDIYYTDCKYSPIRSSSNEIIGVCILLK